MLGNSIDKACTHSSSYPLYFKILIPQISELAQLSVEDLVRCHVDTELLGPVQRALRGLGMDPQAADSAPSNSPSRPGTPSRGTGSISGSIGGSGTKQQRFLSGSSTTMMMGTRRSLATASGGSSASRHYLDAGTSDAVQLVGLLKDHGLVKLLPLVSFCP